MGYCFMSIAKIKSGGEMTAKYNHNYRTVEVSNADPTLKKQNDELIKLQTQSGNGTYYDAFKERIASLPYYQDHNVRKNAVMGLEVLTTFSREENIDIEAWKAKNVEWLKNTFNVAGDGKDNVISVMYHADEPGNVHCHAIVIPIDENGHLNARRFINGRMQLTELQNSYAEDMSEFGLERGLENSQARHKDIKKYYADLNHAIKLAEPEAGELAETYFARNMEHLQELQAAALKKRNDEYLAHQRRMTMERNAIQKELQNCQKALERDIYDGEQKKNAIKADLAKLLQEKTKLNKELSQLGTKIKDVQSTIQKAEFADNILHTYAVLQKTDPEKAQEMYDYLRDVNQEAADMEKNLHNEHWQERDDGEVKQ